MRLDQRQRFPEQVALCRRFQMSQKSETTKSKKRGKKIELTGLASTTKPFVSFF